MSILSWIRQLSPRGKITVGIVGGLLVGVLALLVINSLFIGLPTNPSVYQYDYPNGTSATNPLTETSINTHGSGVALSNLAYEVTYTEETTYVDPEDGEEVVLDSSQIYYQINNDAQVGYLERSNIDMGVLEDADNATVQIYENNSTAYIHNLDTNNTTIQKTGNEPLVLTNQIELPQKLVQAVPHVSWTAVEQRKVGNETVIMYKPKGVNAAQMPQLDSVSSVSGELRVNTRTNVITYSVEITGTAIASNGETVEATVSQSLSYTVLSNSSVPEQPSWATGQSPNTDSDSDDNSSDDDGWTPPGKLSNPYSA